MRDNCPGTGTTHPLGGDLALRPGGLARIPPRSLLLVLKLHHRCQMGVCLVSCGVSGKEHERADPTESSWVGVLAEKWLSRLHPVMGCAWAVGRLTPSSERSSGRSGWRTPCSSLTRTRDLPYANPKL